jgi:hypothetical protein
MTAISIKSNAYYFYPFSSKLNFSLNGGIGYYFGKINYSMKMDESIFEISYFSQSDGTVKSNGIGFHGGIGFEYLALEQVAVFIEARGRYVNLTNWEGDETYSDSEAPTEKRSGTLWYYESYDQDLGKNYSNLRLSEEQPTNLDNVRKFEANFSGISLRAGIRIRF